MIAALACLIALAAPPPDAVLRAGSVGFDTLHTLTSTRDGSLLLAGERWGAFDLAGAELSALYPEGASPPGLMRPSGGFVARVGLDGVPRFLVGASLGAHFWGATELGDGRIFAAGVVQQRSATIGRLTLPARGDDLVGFGAYLSADGVPERAVMIGSSGNVWVRDVAAAGTGVVVVGSFEGRIEGLRPLVPAHKEAMSGSDGFVVKLGPVGDLEWSARVGSRTFTDEARRAVALADGTLLVTGTAAHEVVFEDGRGRTTTERCGDPVICPFLWGLDPDTGATRFSRVLRNGSGIPDASVALALEDGGFVVGGGMGRNLRVGSAVETRRNDEVTLRAPKPVGSSWLARYHKGGVLEWARRVDDKGSMLSAAAVDGDTLWLAGSGDVGVEPGRKASIAGEGPAKLARVRLHDGAFVDAFAFGRPVDAPVTKRGGNVRVDHLVKTQDGRLALAGDIEERAWFHLAQGAVEIASVGANAPGFANENDLWLALLFDPRVLASTALPPSTTSKQDAFEGCVARRAGSLLVPCVPPPRAGERSIHHSCIDGWRGAGDRRVWSCGPIDDEVPLMFGAQELFFLERTARGQLALYGEVVDVGRCGALERMACRTTARMLDGDGGVTWSHALDVVLGGASDTHVSEVRLIGDTLYVVEACWGYEIGHRGRCDQLIALDARTGRVLWKSAPLTVHGPFGVAGDFIVGHSPGTHGTSKSKRRAARLVALDIKSGKLLAELPLSDVSRVDDVDQRGVRVTEGKLGEPERHETIEIERAGARVRLLRRYSGDQLR